MENLGISQPTKKENPISLCVEFGDKKTILTLNEVPSDLETIQGLIIEHIKNEINELNLLEQLDLLVNTGNDDQNSFSQLADFSSSFSDASWWRQITLRAVSHEDDEAKTDNNSQSPIEYFDKELKLNEYDFTINRSHTSKEVREICQIVDLSEVSSDKLMDIFAKTEITSDEMAMWAGYGDSGKIFGGNKETAKRYLNNIVNYCERPAKTSPNIKKKLRMITKLLSQDNAAEKYNVPQLLLYLASHGLACNVLKEVSVDITYSLMTSSVEEFLQEQSVENTILRHLRDLRYNIIEELYSSFGATNNIHGISMLNNYLATQIDGITHIVDPDISNWGLPSGWKDGLVDKFWEKYTCERCLNYIISQINEKRIGYQQIVEWFEVRLPENIEKYEFLSQIFDLETGKINNEYLSWMLTQMDIFTMTTKQMITEESSSETEKKKKN